MTARWTDFSEAYDSYLRAFLESGDSSAINDACRKLFLLWQDSRPTAARVAEAHLDTLAHVARQSSDGLSVTAETIERAGLFLVRVLAGLDALRDSSSEAPQRDRLTGLPNRLSLMTDLSSESARSIRHKRPMSLAVIAVGGLDDLGGATFEVAVYRMAYALGRATRREDRLYRCGRSEFAVLLAETPIGGAMVAAQRYVDSVERTFDAEEIATNLVVTAGIGVATLPMEADDGSVLFDLARRRAHEHLGSMPPAGPEGIDGFDAPALGRSGSLGATTRPRAGRG